MKIRPELLTMPNVPKPLHGIAPRRYMDKKEWDECRFASYEKNGFRCWSCGVHKTEANYHQWLECHEKYKIDYTRGEATFEELVALCHCCHNFIHSGRLLVLLQKGEIEKAKYEYIMLRGFNWLNQHGIKSSWTSAYNWLRYKGNPDPVIFKKLEETSIEIPEDEKEWKEWVMIIGTERYHSLFGSFEEWLQYYQK